MDRARPSRLPLKGGRNVRVDRSKAKAEPKAGRRGSDAPEKVARGPATSADKKEILALVFFALAAVTALALGSYDAAGGGNLVGPVGGWFAKKLFGAFGLSAFVLPVTFAFAFVALVRPQGKRVGLVAACSYLALLCGGAMLLDLVAPAFRALGARAGGAGGGARAPQMV